MRFPLLYILEIVCLFYVEMPQLSRGTDPAALMDVGCKKPDWCGERALLFHLLARRDNRHHHHHHHHHHHQVKEQRQEEENEDSDDMSSDGLDIDDL